jgi:hypothetical protein
MFGRAVGAGGKPSYDLRGVWLVTILAAIGAVVVGALALLIPPDFGEILMIVILAGILGIPLWGLLMYCLSGSKNPDRPEK